jgi:predicted RNase H-like HicB family nuclease
MLAQYLDLALEMARYEIIERNHAYWGEIPGLKGVWAQDETLMGCQRKLREALSYWVGLRMCLGLHIPVVGGLNLNHIGLTVQT